MKHSISNQFIWWQGVVEDIDDPLKLGRVRVRIFGFHNSSKIDIPVKYLPWASVCQTISSASTSGVGISPTGIVCGSWVIGFFQDGESAQHPVVLGTLFGIPQEKNSGLGFSDPNNVYPRDGYLKESDVNRLARNENIDKTVVKSKNDNRETSISSAFGEESWSEPQTEYSAKYPKNHVYETESGHIQEFDDTPNKERIHTYHKSGTFTEIYPNGTKVDKVVKNKYEIILENDRILVKGKKSENINGDYNLKSKNLNVEISGDVNVIINGNTTIETKGDCFHKVGGVYQVVSEGNMCFIAPRIDFNPSGYNASDILSPFNPFGVGSSLKNLNTTLSLVSGLSELSGFGVGIDIGGFF